MKKRFGAGAMVSMWVFGFAVAVLCCTLVLASKFGGAEAFSYTTKFAAVYKTISEEYVGEADMEEISDAAYAAMVLATGDRWSRYMTAEEYESYKLFQQNSYRGIGVTIRSAEEGSYPQVAEVVEDSPAQEAGVEIGDYFKAVEGEDLLGASSEELKNKIAALQDTEFSLTVLRGEQEQELTIKSGVVQSEPVEYELLADGTGYIRIKNFEARAGESAVNAANELAEQGADAIVFDVRLNPGGLLSELITILDFLLPEGDMFVSSDKDGNETVRASDAEFLDLPLAVIVDENTYSAAEFFAAALSEYDRAVLVGTHTTGKARSQINIPLSDGSAIHLSVNRYLTPKRVDLSEAGGLAPDVEVPISDELWPYLYAGELPHESDEQLKAAISALSRG